jgi:hypothetical protein
VSYVSGGRYFGHVQRDERIDGQYEKHKTEEPSSPPPATISATAITPNRIAIRPHDGSRVLASKFRLSATTTPSRDQGVVVRTGSAPGADDSPAAT